MYNDIMYVLIKLAQEETLLYKKILIWFMCITISGKNSASEVALESSCHAMNVRWCIHTAHGGSVLGNEALVTALFYSNSEAIGKVHSILLAQQTLLVSKCIVYHSICSRGCRLSVVC